MRPVTLLAALSLALTACASQPKPAAAPATTSGNGTLEQAATDAENSDATTAPAEVREGGAWPHFETTSSEGTRLYWEGLTGHDVVFYFYPKDETPGCTREACNFRDAFKKLHDAGVVLVGVSADDAESHAKFAEHYQLQFHLVSDPRGELAKLFGVPMHDGMHARQTIVLGKDGKVTKVFRKVEIDHHADEVLAAVHLDPAAK